MDEVIQKKKKEKDQSVVSFPQFSLAMKFMCIVCFETKLTGRAGAEESNKGERQGAIVKDITDLWV